MRLIDADLFESFSANYKGYDRKSYIAGAEAVLKSIDNAPTVDAVSVVRCKNCANRGKKHQCPMMKASDDVYYGSWQDDTEDNYFCSFGESKDGEK